MNPAHGAHALTPEELAEFIASLEEDEVLAATVNCTECDLAYSE